MVLPHLDVPWCVDSHGSPALSEWKWWRRVFRREWAKERGNWSVCKINFKIGEKTMKNWEVLETGSKRHQEILAARQW